MNRFGRMTLICAAAVVAGFVWDLSGRWWLGLLTSFVVTGAAYQIVDRLDRRAAAKEALASAAPDYRLVRH